MCAVQIPAKKKFPTSLVYALMIMLGLLSGYSDSVVLQTTGLFVAEVFIRLFKCISLPIISLSIIVTLANYRTDGTMGSVWRRAMCYTLGTTLVAASISCFLYLLIHPSMVEIMTPKAMQPSQFGYFNHLAALIPSSILAPFLEQQVMSVLLLSLSFGIAVRFIPDHGAREVIGQFFRGAHGLFMVITNWIIAIIPLGLYGFITTTVVQLRAGVAIKGLGEYLFIVVLANLVQGFIILPLWLRWQGIKPFVAFRGMLPALSVAFFSKSSVGTLPITMKTAETNLHINPQISRFVLPLCTSLNMNGCAAFIFATVIYLMQNNGIEVSLAMMALWVVIATIAAIGNAGVPMGCFFLSASLLASMNVPISLLGIILPFYSLIDMLETALNVWSDSCVAKVVNEKIDKESVAQTKNIKILVES